MLQGIIFVLVALMSVLLWPFTATMTGGGESKELPTEIMSLVQERILRDPKMMLGGVDTSVVKHIPLSGKKLKKKPVGKILHWTKYKTWEELFQVPEALAEYEKDLIDPAYDDLPWRNLWPELKSKFSEDREWGGLINIVNGKLKIVSMFHGKNHEHFLTGDAVIKMMSTPALFVFHTHPDIKSAAMGMPSGVDIATTLSWQGLGCGRGHAVFSLEGVVVFGVKRSRRQLIVNAPNPTKAVMELAHDALGALIGRRSWKYVYWTWPEYAQILDLHGIFIHNYIFDKYVPFYSHSWCFRTGETSYASLEFYRKYLKQLEDKEKEKKQK